MPNFCMKNRTVFTGNLFAYITIHYDYTVTHTPLRINCAFLCVSAHSDTLGVTNFLGDYSASEIKKYQFYRYCVCVGAATFIRFCG